MFNTTIYNHRLLLYSYEYFMMVVSLTKPSFTFKHIVLGTNYTALGAVKYLQYSVEIYIVKSIKNNTLQSQSCRVLLQNDILHLTVQLACFTDCCFLGFTDTQHKQQTDVLNRSQKGFQCFILNNFAHHLEITLRLHPRQGKSKKQSKVTGERLS